MLDNHLAWPFFSDAHRTFAGALTQWADERLDTTVHPRSTAEIDTVSRGYVRALGDGGWLRYAVPSPFGGIHERLDVRSLCIAREILGQHSGLAEFAFAMQGLGTGPISLFGDDALKRRYLPPVATGQSIAAFAISEADAGSDIGAMQTTARRDGSHYIVNGEKTWISNAGIADHYVVFCRMDGTARDFLALVIEPDDPGFAVSQRIDTMAPHPLGTITLTDCRVPASRVIGEPGKGLRVALGTLDVFRTTVGAAALGFARRALREALDHVTTRSAFGKPLAEFQLTQSRIATMATEIDASALLVYRAAWTRDQGASRITREAAMAKMYATEAAQRVVDDAVQLLGGRGVVLDHPVERLYRDVRALRIYEGTTEIQQLVIAGQVLGAHSPTEGADVRPAASTDNATR